MNESHPLVSVIIPVFNGQEFIIPCLESVFHQDYPCVEVIVIDDGSTDDTAGAVKQFDPVVTYVYQQHQGTACTRNRGIKLAKGTYLAFLDHDDLWLPEKLTHQAKVMQSIPRPDLVFTLLVQFIDPSISEDERKRLAINEDPMPGVASSTAFMERRVFESVGLFSPGENLEWAEWYMRAAQAGVNVMMVQKVLAKRRVHHNNKGRAQTDYRREYFRLVKTALGRSRQKNRLGITGEQAKILRLNQ